MQTTPGNEKGRRVTSATTPMQTGVKHTPELAPQTTPGRGRHYGPGPAFDLGTDEGLRLAEQHVRLHARGYDTMDAETYEAVELMFDDLRTAAVGYAACYATA